MTIEEEREYYKKQMQPFINENGQFPDTVLGDAIWPLQYCTKHWIDEKLWWSFVENKKDGTTTSK